MSRFKLLIPEATTNLILDPIAGAADPDTSWTIAGDGASPDVTRSTADAFWGDGCFLFDISDGTLTTLYQATTVTATDYTFSCYIKRSGGGVVSNTQVKCWFNNAAVNFDSITLIRDGWYYCVYTATPTAGSRQFGVRALEASLQADGCQLENKAYATTLAYGSRQGNLSDGYKWTGAANSSTSTRSAQERSGGRVRDFVDDLSVLKVLSFSGAGAFPDDIIITDVAQLPGGIYQNNKIQPRYIDIGLVFQGTSDIPHTQRNTFYDAIKARKTTPIQPFVLRYTGGSQPVMIDARLVGGMELTDTRAWVERTALRLVCENPFWRSEGNDAKQLDVQDTLTTNYIAQRGQTSGNWSNLATTINATVRALSKANQVLYVGGSMTAPGNYALSWDGSSLSALSTGPGDDIYSLANTSDGNLWAGSDNSTLKEWNGSSWTSRGSPANTIIYDLLVDGDDNVYMVGDGDVCEYWNGSAIVKLAAASANGAVNAILIDGGYAYFGGAFTTIGGVSAARIARMNLTTGAFEQVGNGIDDGAVYAIHKHSDDNIYIGGSFTNEVDANGDGLIYFDGADLLSNSNLTVAGGNATVYALETFNSRLWVGGDFSTIGGGSSVNFGYSSSPLASGFADIGAGANNIVYDMDTDETYIYLVGAFTNLNSVSSTSRAGRINTSDTISSIGTALGATAYSVYALSSSAVYVGNVVGLYLWNGSSMSSILSGGAGIGETRSIYVVSATEVYCGGSAALASSGSHLVLYDGSNFTAIGVIGDDVLALTANGTDIYIGGSFTNAPGDRILLYDGVDVLGVHYTNETNVTTTDTIYSIIRDTAGNIYLAGAEDRVLKIDTDGFGSYLGTTTFGDTTRTMVINPVNGNIWIAGESGLLSYWNGSKWTTVTTSTTATIYALAFKDNSDLYIGGAFTSIGGVSAEALALYRGGLFYQVDIDLPGTNPTVYAILIDDDEITVGFDAAGSSTTLGTTTVTNNGTADAYPVIYVKGPGDLRQIVNETTGKILQFSGLTLGSGETVTLNLTQFEKNLYSDSRIPSQINSKIQQSDLTDWALMPGDNTVGVYVTNSSATAWLTWELLHESVDGANA